MLTSANDWSEYLDRIDKAALTLALETFRKLHPGEIDHVEKLGAGFTRRGMPRIVRKRNRFTLSRDRIRRFAFPDNPDQGRGPLQAVFDGRYEAAALLKRMFAASLSRYHPDPMGALEAVESHDDC